jgi:hypothetical protein
MRFPPRTLQAIAEGRVDRAFRRWDRPRARAGGQQLTAVGVIGFTSVEALGREAVTDAEAQRAGFESAEALLGFLDRRDGGEIYRITLRVIGADPRVALRETVPDAAAIDALRRRLDRLDRASRHGPWTRQVLELIAANPERRAGELAAEMGRERLPFKADVRKLKALGLTERLPIGYRLSPRGRALLDSLTLAAPDWYHARSN